MASNKFFFFVLTLGFFSCTTAKFPVCTKLSNQKPSSIPGVNQTLFKILQDRHLSVTTLSSTVIEIQGTKRQMKWLQKNYPFILCDFDQKKEAMDNSVYTSCMSNAREWIKVVQGKRPDTLMSPSINFFSCTEQP
jgi:hypothetical protein